MHIAPRYLRGFRYDAHGIAAVAIDGWYYVRRDGRAAPVMDDGDNDAEGYFDGLARSPVGGKIGFIDRRLRLVIPAKYDGAYHFLHGVAEICMGCKITRAGEDGEWTYYDGGLWGCIDRRGRLIAPMRPRKGMEDVCGRKDS